MNETKYYLKKTTQQKSNKLVSELKNNNKISENIAKILSIVSQLFHDFTLYLKYIKNYWAWDQ